MGYFILVIACLVILLYGYLTWENRRLKAVHYTVWSDKMKCDSLEVKMVLLTDLHGQTYGEKNARLLAMVREQNPDIVLIAGDMFVKCPQVDTKVAADFVLELAKSYPVYYGNGNHEKKVCEFWEESKEAFKSYKKQLEDAGVHYLMNESEELDIQGNRIRITGLDLDLRHYHKFWKPETFFIEEMKENVRLGDGNAVEILIAHNPLYFPIYKEWGADLVVSGHVHGGIMILPVLGGVISPTLRLFPKYDYGLFKQGKSTMVLSKGLGVHTLKFRFFNVPEVSVIHMKGK